MKLELVTDNKIVREVMTDPEMWEKIHIDGVDKNTFFPEIQSNMVIVSAFVKSVIGLHLFVHGPNGVIYHPMLLKPFRKEFGREFITSGLNWIFQNTATPSLRVEIPTDHKHNINLAKHFDFKEVGTRKDGMVQDGEMLKFKILQLDKGDVSWAA